TLPQKINSHMHTILVENQMDNFTVTEARDVLISSTNEFHNKNEARKTLYRQIYHFAQKGWLLSSGEGSSKRYSTTEEFRELNVIPNKMRSTSNSSDTPATNGLSQSEISLLKTEKREVEAELEITLSEIEQYKLLEKRFSKLSQVVDPLIKKASERSADLLGNLNALSNVLRSLSGVQS
ncbi:hypothetical protein, partial [Vibrio parahaemolyticus]|uniref:hypothetical protein n=8 Tax=Vibrio TaxID=662 RepID=UPI001C60FE56